MKRSAKAPAPAVSLLRGTLAVWLLGPCIIVVFALGLALLTEGVKKARETNEHLATALCRYLDIFVSDAHSNLASLARLEGRSEPDHILAAIRQTQESLTRFQRIVLVDADGIVRFTHPPGFVGVDFPVLFPPESNSTMSRPLYSSDTGSLTILMRAKTASGQMIAGELNLNALLEHLHHFSLDLHGTVVAATDGFGNLIAHPDMALVRQQTNIGDWRIFKEASDAGAFSALAFRDGSFVSDTVAQLPGHKWKVILSTSLWHTMSDTLKIVATIEILLVAYFLILFLSVRRTLNLRIIRPIVEFSKSMTGLATSQQPDPPAPAPFQELGLIEREFRQAISAILESQARLRTSQAILEQAQSIGRMGSWRLDLVENRLTWSDEAYRIFGATQDEVEPSYELFMTLVHPDDRAAVDHAYTSSIKENRDRYEIEHRIVRRDDGEIRFVIERCVHERDAEGTITRSVGMVQDITERKREEEELLLAKEQAEAANRAKSEFLANMSHEIRTPLNGILGMLQLLETSVQDKEELKFCALAIQSTNRLTSLLSDILDLSRVEASMMLIRSKRFDLRSVLTQIIDLFAPVAVQTGVTLTRHLDPGLPIWVVGDSLRLQQVLTNLIGNSFKFTKRGHVHVEAYPLPSRRKDTFRVFFAIEDTGCGIADEELGNLFQPFTQVSQGYTRNHQGAGLGLTISKQLVALMGGNMAVASEEGVGTTFAFCVTFSKEVRPHDDEAALEKRTAPPASLQILLAEDDETTGFSISRLLEKSGHSVTMAHNGQEALELHESHDFDLILMDVSMPVMDGIEACQRIRGSRNSHKRDIPIIALTAYAMAGDKEKFLAAGMSGYVAKPINMETLTQMMAETLAEQRR
ncbi:MAG: response regulator [Desulfomicrobium sp.]|nr:response regulator [Pseudomonadota bacterium]MBV1713420.1 response regulator [Desulfomicrobium sp.]MBU4570446.1 response regulator [Pseudomonadota bacterium]MBU4593803.1 response regulator [Pseudomonadota bacterium]MBV1719743.1 response regulator [Desulfomicrobium sp.]